MVLLIVLVNAIELPTYLSYLIISNAVFLALIHKNLFNFINSVKQLWTETEKEINSQLNQEREQLQNVLEKYKDPLSKKRSELIFIDDYGDVDYSKWVEEITTFYKSKIIGKHHLSLMLIEDDELFQYIEDTSFNNEQNQNKAPIIDFRFYQINSVE